MCHLQMEALKAWAQSTPLFLRATTTGNMTVDSSPLAWVPRKANLKQSPRQTDKDMSRREEINLVKPLRILELLVISALPGLS